MTLPIPTIHLNGTAQHELSEQLSIAWTAVTDALIACSKACPHGRDYYPQGAQVIEQALAAHRSRLDRLEAVRNEISAMIQGVLDQKH